MASLLKMLLSTTFVCLLASSMAMSRPLDTKGMLLSRSQLAKQGSKACWDSLLELQSCTGEVVLFFLNGETYLGANCCHAIRVITKQCWPAMLGSVGIDSEEGDILVGYCDAAASASASDPPLSLEAVAAFGPSPASHGLHT